MRPFAVITLALILAPVAAQADVYRWVDATGEVHYSDRPIEGAVLVNTSNPRPPTPANPTGEVTRRVASAAPSEAQTARDAERAVAKDLAAQRAKQCTDAKERYEKSIQARRIFRTTETGEREFLSDAEADQIRLGNRTAMDAVCGTQTAAR